MTIGEAGIKLIKTFEGCRLKAYLCPASVATIGFGNTYYIDGRKVQLGDVINQQQADHLLKSLLPKYEEPVNRLAKGINQNQFDSLVSFVYNVGSGNFATSTLLKKINANPNDPAIREQFEKWNKGGGKVLPGLVTRRKAESELYFKPIINP